MATNLSNRLTELRNKIGESQLAVAEACSISHTALGRYESGTRTPRAEVLAKLADYYGVSVDYIIGNEENTAQAEEEAWHIRERLRRDPDYKILFDAAGKATPEHLRAAAAMLKALEGDN